MKRPSEEKTAGIIELLFSAATLVSAAMLIAACIGLCLQEMGLSLTGPEIKQVVLERLGQLTPVFWLWLGLLAVALIFPNKSRGSLPKVSVEDELALLSCRREKTPLVLREEKKRKAVTLGFFGICLACAGWLAVFFSGFSRVPIREGNRAIIKIAKAAISCLLLCSAALWVWKEYGHRSICREIALLKEAPLRKAPFVLQKPCRRYRVIRIGMIGLSVLLVILGIANGGMKDVLEKAIKICSECIGLG